MTYFTRRFEFSGKTFGVRTFIFIAHLLFIVADICCLIMDLSEILCEYQLSFLKRADADDLLGNQFDPPVRLFG